MKDCEHKFQITLNKSTADKTIKDPFSFIVRNKFYIYIYLNLPREVNGNHIPGQIEFYVTMIEKSIVDETPQEDLLDVCSVNARYLSDILRPDPEFILSRWISIIEYLEDKSKEKAESRFPNEYTFGYLTWRKFNMLSLNSFDTCLGAKMRLEYLVLEMIRKKVIDKDEIVASDKIKKYTSLLIKPILDTD